MDIDLIDDAACAASDLTARLQADLTRTRAKLAVLDAHVLAAARVGATAPTDVTTERILLAEQAGVLQQLLDGVPAIEAPEGGGCHAASA